jgi:hypothetical protein
MQPYYFLSSVVNLIKAVYPDISAQFPEKGVLITRPIMLCVTHWTHMVRFCNVKCVAEAKCNCCTESSLRVKNNCTVCVNRKFSIAN